MGLGRFWKDRQENANASYFWGGAQNWASGKQGWKLDFLHYILNIELCKYAAF